MNRVESKPWILIFAFDQPMNLSIILKRLNMINSLYASLSDDNNINIDY